MTMMRNIQFDISCFFELFWLSDVKIVAVSVKRGNRYALNGADDVCKFQRLCNTTLRQTACHSLSEFFSVLCTEEMERLHRRSPFHHHGKTWLYQAGATEMCPRFAGHNCNFSTQNDG